MKGEGVDVGGFEGVFFRLFVLHFLFEEICVSFQVDRVITISLYIIIITTE